MNAIDAAEEKFEILICPDCRGELSKIELGKEIIGLCCSECELIYPVKDGIPIVLAKEARNYDLEYPLIKKIEKRLSHGSFASSEYIEKTLNLIVPKKDTLSWEWQDERYWSKEYAVETRNRMEKNWNDRIWQRESLVEELTNRMGLRGRTVLDVGCGEGQNFRILLSRYCDQDTLYIGADISFTALRLSRTRNQHRNSLFVLCSADYELPFEDHTVDVLCYFGILHHTKNKSDNLRKDKRVLRKNGCIILSESLDRPELRQFLPMLRAKGSAYEGFVNKRKLLAQLEKNGSNVVFFREEGTPFFAGMMALFNKAMLHNKKLFQLILNLDILIAKTLGGVLSFFRAGEILLLARQFAETSGSPI